MVMTGEDKLRSPFQIGLAIFGIVGKENIDIPGVRPSDKLLHFFQGQLRGIRFMIINQGDFQACDCKPIFPYRKLCFFIVKKAHSRLPETLLILQIFPLKAFPFIQLVLMVSERIVNFVFVYNLFYQCLCGFKERRSLLTIMSPVIRTPSGCSLSISSRRRLFSSPKTIP